MLRKAALFLLALPIYATGQASLHVVMLLEKPGLGGSMRVALCPSRQAYNSDQGCQARTVQVEGPSAVCDFDNLPAGTYAVKVFQDANKDGLLNTSWLGWPKEPVGYSNDAPINTGTPPFKLAAVALDPGKRTLRIRVR